MSSNKNSKGTEDLKKRITEMVDKVDDEILLNRIYRFVKFIYIRKTKV